MSKKLRNNGNSEELNSNDLKAFDKANKKVKRSNKKNFKYE